MRQHIAYISYLVRDYDEAIVYFTQTRRFTLMEDTDLKSCYFEKPSFWCTATRPSIRPRNSVSPLHITLGGGKRWVLVAPPGAAESCLLLAKAATPVQQQSIGAQAGGRVFLCTDDFWRDYHDMRARGVAFAESPQQEGYGTVAVFQDLYGNRWDLLQLKSNTTTSTL